VSAAYVPFTRQIRQGTQGKDALAVKRALSSAGFMQWGGFTNLFGPFAVRALKNFQKAHGLAQDGRYDLADHKKLGPYFDPYGAWLMGQAAVTPEETKRRAIVAAAMLGYAHRSTIHYTQGPLRMWGVKNKTRPPKVPPYEDCSSFATWCYWVAGAKDPNGPAFNFNGYGYTGTQINAGRQIPSSQLKRGDLVFYGTRSIPSHVAVYVGDGRVVSHGSEVGPLLLPRTYRGDLHSCRSYL
jgi:peptidoglycan hydrolase-like protein with peptidoglycan-binding domain